MLYVMIHNRGDHHDQPSYGNYEYVVHVNGHVIAAGQIEDHRRDEGWEMLVFMLLEQELAKMERPNA